MSAIQIATQLETTVTAERAWLLSLDEQTVHHRPSPDRWTIMEVVGHLIDSACNNHQRFVRAQDEEELAFPKYEQNSWVRRADYANADWAQLVELWYLYNVLLSQLMRNIPDNQLPTPCTIEPYETCTLGFLVSDYLDHLNHHLAKMRERTS